MFSGYVVRDDVLDQPVAYAAYMLLEQHGPELLQTGRGILERAEDRFALVDLEAEDPRVVVEGAPQPVPGRIVGELLRDPLDELAADGDAGERDVGRRAVRLASGHGALLSSSMAVTGSAVDDDPTPEAAA
jgi:hypothetical protein